MASFAVHSEPTHPPPTGPLPPLPKTRQSVGPILKRSVTGTSTPVSSQPRQLPKPTIRTSSAPSAPLTDGSSSPSPTATAAASMASNSQASGDASRKRKMRETISYKCFPKPPTGTPRMSSLAPSGSLSSPTVVSPLEETPRVANRSFSGATVTASVTSPTSSSPLYPTHLSEDKPYNIDRDISEVVSASKMESAADDPTSRYSLKKKHNVIVSIRVRPDTTGATNGVDGDWDIDGDNSQVAYKGQKFEFDNVFTATDDNAKVYTSAARRIARKVMDGYHGTMFAYGTTGTGKTFSMQGTSDQPGIIPHAIHELFSYIKDNPQREFLLRASYLEIYNEKIYDLLSSPDQREHIKLREDSRRGVYATPIIEELVQSEAQLARVIARGDHNRRTSATEYNVRSSRSHAVVQILVESRERSSTLPNDKRAPLSGVRVSTLSLIDLAGSEKAADSKERRTEGSHINKSLLTLSTIMSRLSGKTSVAEKHLPFRDSKLTRLLQPELSGDALVSILCTIQISNGPGPSNSNEMLNTLNFAARARNNLVSHAKKAQETLGDSESRALLEQYRTEIIELRKQVEEQKSEKARAREEEERQGLELEAEAKHQAHMLEMKLARIALQERLDNLNQQLVISSEGQRYSSSVPQSSFLRLDNPNAKSGRASNPNPLLSQTKTYDEQGVSILQDDDTDDEERTERETSSSTSGDSSTSLEKQVKSLHTLLSEKEQYITTIEKLLDRARQSNQSAPKAYGAAIVSASQSTVVSILREKDEQIAALKEVIHDKDRMVTALRSAITKTKGIGDTAISSSTTAGARSTSAPYAITNAKYPIPRIANGATVQRYINGTAEAERTTNASGIARLTPTPANLARLRVGKPPSAVQGNADKSGDKVQSSGAVPKLPSLVTQVSSPPVPDRLSPPNPHSPAVVSNTSEDGEHSTGAPSISPLERLTKRVTHNVGSRKTSVAAQSVASTTPTPLIPEKSRTRTLNVKA